MRKKVILSASIIFLSAFSISAGFDQAGHEFKFNIWARVARTVHLGLNNQAFAAKALKLGLFDPSKTYSRDRRVSIEHAFVEWQAEASRLPKFFRYSKHLDRQPMLTIEPWPSWRWQRLQRDGDTHMLLSNIQNGDYDPEIKSMCGQIGATGDAVLVRWGHEMEDGRYPWSNAEPSDFIAAFRYFVRECRNLAPNAHFVWSPKGHRQLQEYYPGDEYVDFIGVSLFAIQKAELAYYGKPRSAAESISERYSRISRYNKPVIIAELGVFGSDKYLETWFSHLREKISLKYPLIDAVVYFSDTEPHRLPEPIGAPDWQLGTEYFLGQFIPNP